LFDFVFHIKILGSTWPYSYVSWIYTYAIGDYHHWCCEIEFRSGGGVQHYVL